MWKENGNYVEKGPFPKTTSVLVQELTRDDDTGETTLKLSPIYGDKIYYEVNAPATPASLEVAKFNEFKTTELRLSFLCVDSSNNNETGPPVEWVGKITLKYNTYNNSAGKTMMEIASAPPAEIRYTTDGSSPLDNGALYDGDFEIPEDAQFVLAVGVAPKYDVQSETLQVKVPRGPGGGKPGPDIDKNKPLTLFKMQKTNDTEQTYAMLNTLKKHQASIASINITIDKNGKWAELNTDPDSPIDPAVLEQKIDNLRDIIADEDKTTITLEYKNAHYPSGQHFLDWVEENKLELKTFKPSEVKQ